MRILEGIRILKLENKTKFYQASTSELYGATKCSPQNESTPFSPRSPYAAAKLYAYWITSNYRDAYGYMRVMAYYSIMKAQSEAKHLLPEKLQEHSLELNLDYKIVYI